MNIWCFSHDRFLQQKMGSRNPIRSIILYINRKAPALVYSLFIPVLKQGLSYSQAPKIKA